MFYMFLAEGFEETEALVTLDMMKRAKIDVLTVGINGSTVKGTHGITVFADITSEEFSISDCDGIILPGGMPGTENLYSDNCVKNAVEYCFESKKLIAAICAAPIILGRRQLLKEYKAVCFPGFECELIGADIPKDCMCVTDRNIITAKGAGCVFEFSYDIIRYICGKETACSIIEAIQHKGF